jgi:hypothetical protein
MRKDEAWRQYQRDTAVALEELGFKTEIEAEVKGARGKHKIDVFASKFVAGIQLRYAAECKFWKTKVPKAEALTFLAVVNDIGANIGLLFTESGCQPGAHKATDNTNVKILSLDEFRELNRPEREQNEYKTYRSRVGILAEAFWVNKLPTGLDLTKSMQEYPNPMVIHPSHRTAILAIEGMLHLLDHAYYDNWPVPVGSMSRNGLITINTWEEARDYLEVVCVALEGLQFHWACGSKQDTEWDRVCGRALEPLAEWAANGRPKITRVPWPFLQDSV